MLLLLLSIVMLLISPHQKIIIKLDSLTRQVNFLLSIIVMFITICINFQFQCCVCRTYLARDNRHQILIAEL